VEGDIVKEVKMNLSRYFTRRKAKKKEDLREEVVTKGTDLKTFYFDASGPLKMNAS